MSGSVLMGITPTRLTLVEGFSGLRNDVVYVAAGIEAPKDNGRRTLVFFGGDVQDYAENMSRHRDNRRYVNWNLESTATMLSQSFPQYDVIAIKGSCMYLNTFVCYKNFLHCNSIGVPEPVDADDNLSAHRHLLALVRRTYEMVYDSDLTNSSAEHKLSGSDIGEQSVAGMKSSTAGCCRSSSLALVGFSKGCVVLNRLVHELHAERSSCSETMSDFLSRTTDIYWLDGGHSGGSDVWITESRILKSLAETGIRLHVHVTPYQMEDHRRPWIRKEEKVFTATLRNMNANINRTLHFANDEPSIELHFGVLRAFQPQPPTTT